MSDHPPKETKRTLKKIFICNDGCFDVFRLLPPKKVGLEVAAVSDRFDALVDTQFEHYRKWALGKLGIHSGGIVKMNADRTYEHLPFPQVPLPNSVVSFARVIVGSFDSDAIAFLQRIGRLFQSNISLDLSIREEENWDTFATSVLPLMNVFATIEIYFKNPIGFHHFRRVTSPSILRDCAGLRIVISPDNYLRFPLDDSDGSCDGQALCRWLHTPRADGRPKVLRMDWTEGFCLVDFQVDFESHFLNATTPINFIVCFRSLYPYHPFELVNSATREQMTSRIIDNRWTIVRCPIDRNEKQWAEWVEEAVKCRFGNDWKVIDIRAC